MHTHTHIHTQTHLPGAHVAPAPLLHCSAASASAAACKRQSAVSTCTRGRGSRAGRGTCAGARFEYTCPPLTRRLIGGFALERSCTSSPHTWETLHGRLTSNTAERGWRAPHGTHAGRRRARRRGRHPPWTTGDGSAAGSGKRRRHSAQLGVKVPAAGSGWPASASRSALPCSRTLDDGAPDPAAAPVAAVSTCTRRSPRCNESSSCASLRSAPRLQSSSTAEATKPSG